MISSNLRSQSMYGDNNIRFITTCKTDHLQGKRTNLSRNFTGHAIRLGHARAKEIAFRSPPALEWHKDISRQRTSSLLFSRNTYDKTIWASSAISLLTQKVPVRRRDVIDIKVRLSHFVTWLVASFVALRKGPKLVSTELFIGIPVVAQS